MSKNHESKPLIKATLHMAWPSVVESFFIAFVGLVDSLMVSRLGAYAVAAVGLTIQPKFLGLIIFFALNIAVSALVAWRKGEDNRQAANRIFLTALCLSIILGIVVSIISYLTASPVIRLIGSEADTHAAAVEYLRIVMGGIIFQVISMVINAAQRGSGYTRISMRTSLTANVFNVIFNYLLINGNLGFPALGVRGAAIATVLSSMIACGMSFQSLFQKNSYIQIKIIWQDKITPAIESLKQILKFAYTAFIEQLLLRFGFLIVALLTARLGTNAMAIQQVTMNLMGISFALGEGLQVAAVSLIGQSMGSGNPELARRYGRICHRIGYVISGILAIFYLFGGRWYYSLFFTEASMIDTGRTILYLMMIIVVLQISQVIYMGCLRGAGDIKVVTFISLLGVGICRPLFSYIFAYPLGFGIIGIWIGCIFDQIVRMGLSLWRFESGKWMKKKL